MASSPYLGAIFMFAGNFAPKGYLLCAGQLLSIQQNQALFSLLGTFYGGNGVETFALPDLRGRVPTGVGQGPGLNPVVIGQSFGTQTVTLNSSHLPTHTHSLRCNISGASSPDPTGHFPGNAGLAPADAYYSGSAGNTMSGAMLLSSGGGTPLNVQNPLVGINYIICTAGVFPSRN